MENFGQLLIFVFSLILGFGMQEFINLSPQWNLGLAFLLVFILPPGWSMGLVSGIWIACAFFTDKPKQDRNLEAPVLNLTKVFTSALWSFSGFILTLFLIWKFKLIHFQTMGQRETIGWIFLTLMEVCLLRIVVRHNSPLYRLKLGYGIGFFDFLFILWWVFPFGIVPVVFTFIWLLIGMPLIITWVDLPLNIQSGISLRRK